MKYDALKRKFDELESKFTALSKSLLKAQPNDEESQQVEVYLKQKSNKVATKSEAVDQPPQVATDLNNSPSQNNFTQQPPPQTHTHTRTHHPKKQTHHPAQHPVAHAVAGHRRIDLAARPHGGSPTFLLEDHCEKVVGDGQAAL